MIADPIEFELFKNSILSIADEMALTIFRTTYSCVLKDNMDYSTAMFDGAGNLVAQGLTLPGHLGSMPTAMRAMLDAFVGDINPGDIYTLNDPFRGGMHLPDIFVFKPVFHRGQVLAYAATICHHTDVGGRVRRIECVGFNRDLSRRPAYPANEDVRSRQTQRNAVRAD